MNILSPQMVDEFRFNAGIDVVHADQVDEYNAFLDSLGIGGEPPSPQPRSRQEPRVRRSRRRARGAVL